MKSRNLFMAASMAVMVGGMVLAPSLALAQSRDRDSSRDSSHRNRDRDHVTREDQNRRSSDRDHNVWNGSRDRNDNRSGNWWDHPTSDRDRSDRSWRDRDRDRDRDDWRRDDRRTIIVNRYPTYVYRDNGYRDNGYRDYGYNDYSSRDANDWRSIADAAGLLAVIGLLDHDDTLTFIGGVGALYSLDRYDNDQHSRDRYSRLRAEYFSHPYFVRDGRRYDRELVTVHGDRYYRFVCR